MLLKSKDFRDLQPGCKSARLAPSYEQPLTHCMFAIEVQGQGRWIFDRF